MAMLPRATPRPFSSTFPVVCLAFSFPRTLLYHGTAIRFSGCSVGLPATPGAENRVICHTWESRQNSSSTTQSFPKMKSILTHQQPWQGGVSQSSSCTVHTQSVTPSRQQQWPHDRGGTRKIFTTIIHTHSEE